MRIQGKEYRTIWYEDKIVKIIDQTKLPHQFIIKDLKSVKDAINAIKVMEVRGAPLIGATAAYGIVLAIHENNSQEFISKCSEELIKSRPTAINLKWAVNRMMKKMHYEGVEEMNEDFRTGRFGVSVSLVDAVKDIIMGKRINEKEGDKEAYQKFFQKALKKFGVSSPSELKGDKEKEFYDYVDKNWTADHEESKKVNEAAKKAVKEDEEEHDDEDEKETAKKAKKDEPKKNGKEKVEVDPTLDEKLDEGSMKDKLIKTADLIQKMIKPGDPDRHDYAAARDHIEANNMKTLKKIVMNMDTVPKEKIAVALAKGLGKAEAEKILGVKLNMSEEVKEEMTEAQKEKREEIVKELKKKTEDFKKKYGDRWEDVMYATATKMAMKAA